MMLSIVASLRAAVAKIRILDPSYQNAHAGIDGGPWREAPKSTDAWFILDEEAAAMSPPPVVRRWNWSLIGLAVVASVVLAGAATHLVHRSAPAGTTPPATPAPVSSAQALGPAAGDSVGSAAPAAAAPSKHVRKKAARKAPARSGKKQKSRR